MTTLKFSPNGVSNKTVNKPVRSTTVSQLAKEPIDILIKQHEVCRAIGCQKTRFYEMIKKGEFPKPIRLGSRSVAWLLSDVQKYIDDRVAESRGNA